MDYSIGDALRDIENRIAEWRNKATDICSSFDSVLIFGAGFYGSFLANQILPKGGAKGVIDNNKEMHGCNIGELAVASFEEYADRYPDACVLISIADKEGARKVETQCRAGGMRALDFCPESLSSGMPPFGGNQIRLWLETKDNPSLVTAANAGEYAPLDDFIGTGCLVSYAEAGEDAIFLEYLHPVKTGVYVDIGCADPELCSVTKLFYDLGWNGINIDPRASEIAKYFAVRPRDINLSLGISNIEGKLPFWVAGPLSTFNREQTKEWRHHPLFKTMDFIETTVPVTTLTAVLDQYLAGETFHFLKIDAETHEKQVLEGLDMNRYRPWMIMVEGASKAVEKHLVDNNYVFIRKNSINYFYVSNEKKEELLNNCLSKPVFFMLRREHATITREILNTFSGRRKWKQRTHF